MKVIQAQAPAPAAVDVNTVQPAAETTAPPAGFEDLAASAAELEGGPPVPGTEAAAQYAAASVKQTASEVLQALKLGRMMVAPMFRWWRDFGQVWGDDTLQGIATGGAAVMQRHGWTLGDLFEKWGPYIALATATVPPSIVTYQAVKAYTKHLEQQAKNKPPPTPTEGAADGADQQTAH